MSDKMISMFEEQFLALVYSLLNDENGISEESYHLLYTAIIPTGNLDLWDRLSRHIDATDGRFYLKEGTPSLVDLIGNLMYIVITGSMSDSNYFFGPFTDIDEARRWAREYSIQHSKTVDVVLLSKPFDLGNLMFIYYLGTFIACIICYVVGYLVGSED